MTRSAFMPSWAALLRERYLERSRQQESHIKGRQAYHYEIHRKLSTNPHQKPDHDIASCPYVTPGQTPKHQPRPHSAPSAPTDHRIKAIPIRLIPVWKTTSAVGAVYEPVAHLPHKSIDAQVRGHMVGDQTLVNSRSLPYNETIKVEYEFDDRLIEIVERGGIPVAVSEYGFYYEERGLPRYNDYPPHHPDLTAHHGHNAPAGMRWPTPTPLLDSQNASTPPRSPVMHSRHYPYHNHAVPHQHGRVRHSHHHHPYRPHLQDCACNRYERCRANRYSRKHAAVNLPHLSSLTPVVRNAHRQCSPATPITHHPARVSFHTERRPSYVRTRTPSPRRREI